MKPCKGEYPDQDAQDGRDERKAVPKRGAAQGKGDQRARPEPERHPCVARDAGAAVLPVTISGARRIMPGHALSMGWGRASVTVHPPIPSAGKSVEELANAARLSIESALRDVDDLPVPPPRGARGGASTAE